jgi:CspA family cold shock protein
MTDFRRTVHRAPADLERGTIKWYDPKKGYGFIRSATGEDVFIHKSVLMKYALRAEALVRDVPIKFKSTPADRGGLEAIAISL